MDLAEVQGLVALIRGSDINEFIFESGQQKLVIRRIMQTLSDVLHDKTPDTEAAPDNGDAVVAAASQTALEEAAPAVVPQQEDMAAEEEAGLCYATAAMVGTFYQAPKPGAAPYVRVGDRVKKGQVLCLLEAMKLNFEVEAAVDGIVSKVYVADGEPVEFGQKLIAIKAA